MYGNRLPIGGLVVTLFWLAVVGVLALLGGALSLVIWLVQHVRFT